MCGVGIGDTAIGVVGPGDVDGELYDWRRSTYDVDTSGIKNSEGSMIVAGTVDTHIQSRI